MTKIIKLEMKGFKSFAQKTDLVFGDDFNVVIGPNGSGKSNVFDALCFVLGKSSAKGLRAEKSANLIYNGGKAKTPAKSGEVSIYFDNSGKEFPTSEKEVKISRVVKASGQSTYYINSKKHTRNEVVDFLHHARINPDGYNIILQGDIIRFVEMSGEKRRGIVEEIADISVYEEKKAKAFSELTKVEDSFKEAEIILKERSNYLKDLASEKEQANKYEEYESTVKRGKATLLSRSIAEKKAKVDKIHEGNASAVAKQKELQQTISQNKEKITAAKTEVKEINDEVEKKGDAEQVAIHKEIEGLKIAIATDGTKLDGLRGELAKIKDRKSQLQGSLDELNAKVKSLSNDEKNKRISQQQNLKMKAEIEAKIKKFKEKHKIDGSNSVDKEIEELDSQIETLQNTVDNLRVKQQDMLRTKDRLEIQIRTADEKIEKVLAVSKEHKDEIKSLKQKKEEFKKVTLELNKSLSDDSALASQVGNARSRSYYLQEELAKIQAKKASIQETLGGSLAVSKIIENKKKFGGVNGTVSSLGNVSSKYAKALEIAAGGRIKSIVVEDDGVGAECITYLKSNKLGVASFLPLNKIRGVPADKDVQALIGKPGVHGRAIDLIKYDAKYRNVFSFVFGNTLVVDNIAVARKLGIGIAKMVTLEGDVAEKSGAMQGGFRKPTTSGSGFSQHEVNEKEKDIEEELADISAVLSSVEKKKVSSEENITKLRDFKANLEGDIIRLEKGLHLDDSDLDVSSKLKKEFEAELEKIDEEVMTMQMQVSIDTRNLANFKIKKQQLRNEMSELRNPTKLAELNTFEEQLTNIKEILIRSETELKHMAEQQQNLIGHEEENIRRVIKSTDKEESDFKENVATLQGKSKMDSVRLSDLEQQEKAFYKQFQKAFDRRKVLTDQIEKLESQTIIKEEEIRNWERKLNVVSVEVAKLNAEISVLNDEYAEYANIEVYKSIESAEIKKRIYNAEQQLEKIGPVNMKAVAMYDTVKAEYDKLVTKREILKGEKENILVMINQIESRKTDLFLKVYERLNTNFKRIFATLSEKGEAYLELENPEQPFEGGVNVKVKLSGKKFMDIRSLSGGEKTMTALAFIFAIQENDPASFYIMDEVDAALDKRNAEKLAELVRQYCDRAQYIVVSHNDGVISSADTLYGVSMDQQSGVSKVVSLKL